MRSVCITLKTTDACNMRCKHCYHTSVGYTSRFLDIEHAKKILELASKEYDFVDVLFMGGEPTLWGIENFIELLKYQYSLSKLYTVNFKNSLQTNGLMLNLQWINFLKKYNFRVGISFDGPHNDDLRGKTQTIFLNLKLAQENNLAFHVLCVENNNSIKNLDYTYNWFKKNNFNFKILPIFMSGEALKHKNLELDPDEYVEFFIGTYKKWLKDENCEIEVSTFQELLKINHKCICNHRGASCISNRVAIVANGDIFPCGRPYTDDFRIGNILEFQSIKDMFESKAYKYIMEIYQNRLKNCNSCEVFESCKGGCISDAILENFFEKIDNPYCIRTKKMLKQIHVVNQNIYSSFVKKTLQSINPIAKIIIQNSMLRYHNANLSTIDTKM